MKFSLLDVVLVAVFLTAAIVGGALGVLSKELVAAIITASVAFLAARGKTLFDKNARSEKRIKEEGVEDRQDKKEERAEDRLDEKKGVPDKAAEGVPDKALEPGHSHRIVIAPNGTVTIENLDASEVENASPDAPKSAKPTK